MLAAVTIGVYMAVHAPSGHAQTRLHGAPRTSRSPPRFVLFTLVGLPGIVDALKGLRSWEDLVAWGAVLLLTVIAIRFAWLFLTSWLPRPMRRRRRQLAIERHPRAVRGRAARVSRRRSRYR